MKFDQLFNVVRFTMGPIVHWIDFPFIFCSWMMAIDSPSIKIRIMYQELSKELKKSQKTLIQVLSLKYLKATLLETLPLHNLDTLP